MPSLFGLISISEDSMRIGRGCSSAVLKYRLMFPCISFLYTNQSAFRILDSQRKKVVAVKLTSR